MCRIPCFAVCLLALVSATITEPGAGGGSDVDCTMAPEKFIPLDGLNTNQGKMAEIHNAKHAFLQENANRLSIAVADLAGAVKVESGGTGFRGGRMIIRFEVHVFWDRWGRSHLQQFNDHFDFDRSEGGRRWTQHKFRNLATDAWEDMHAGAGAQDLEWRVLRFAQALDDTAALNSASYGAAQVMGFNFQKVGYTTPQGMFVAYSTSIRTQMQGLIAFIENSPACLAGLTASPVDLVQFAGCYNGAGKAQEYADRISAASAIYADVIQRTLCDMDGQLGVCVPSGDSTQSCTLDAADGVNGCVAGRKCCVNPINTETGMYNGEAFGTCTVNSKPGACYDRYRCAGTTFGGKCGGGGNIKCCIRDQCVTSGNRNGGGGSGNGAGNPTPTPPSSGGNAEPDPTQEQQQQGDVDDSSLQSDANNDASNGVSIMDFRQKKAALRGQDSQLRQNPRAHQPMPKQKQ